MENITPLKTYTKEYFCMNCNQISVKKLPFGVIVDLQTEPCPNCGIVANEYQQFLTKVHSKASTGFDDLADSIRKLAESIDNLSEEIGK